MATLVATGTNGFIGTNVVEELLKCSKMNVFKTAERTSENTNAISLALTSDLPESATINSNRAPKNRFSKNKFSFAGGFASLRLCVKSFW